MINILGIILNGIFDILLLPFRLLPSFWGLLFISLLSGLGMIVIFSKISNQEKISRLRKKMAGGILGILLHVNSPGTVIGFAGKLIRTNTVYLAQLLKPLLVIAIPFALLWGQLDARYGTDRMVNDMPVTVTLKFNERVPERDSLRVMTSGLEFIPPFVMIDTLNEVSFRVLPSGDSLRSLEIAGTEIRMEKTGKWNGCRILRGFDSGNSLGRLFRPWTGRIEITEDGPASGLYSLPDVRYRILGGHWSWIAVFLVFSTLSAAAGAKLFKVKI